MELVFDAGAAGAVSWGLLTAISPCPMATNIAAMSFMAQRISNPRAVLLSGLLYTAGRTVAYVGLAYILVAGILTESQASHNLEK